MKKIILLSGFVALMLTNCSSPKLASLATKDDLSGKAKYDFNRAQIKESGRGFSVDMKKLGAVPKKVALVSFYIDDPGITKITKGGTTKSWNTTNTGADNARIYANQYYKQSIETMKTTFQSYGMEILTPDQFLTDDDKKQFYNDFVVKHTTLNKVGEKLMKGLKNMGNAGTTIEVDEAADGFKLVKINKREMSDDEKKAVSITNLDGSNDAQMIESIGYDLCKNLEVDAVLIVFNTQLADTKWAKTRFWMSAVNMHMFGPNPLPLKEGKKDNMFYSKGIWYCGLRMHFKKGLLINSAKRKATPEETALIEKNNEIAYKNIIKGLSTKMGTYYQKELK